MPGAPRIALNALFLDPGVSGGPETYLRGLAPALAECRPAAQIDVLTTRRGAVGLTNDGWPAAGLGVVAMPCDEGQRVRRLVVEQALTAHQARRRGCGLLHSLASMGPVRTGRLPHVITVHDATFVRHQTFGGLTTRAFLEIVPRAARNADALLTGSAAARDDVCDAFGLDPAAFAVVPHGVNPPAMAQAVPADAVRRAFGLAGRRVVLCVAAKRPHKNQALLVRALPLLSDDVTLVLAGHPEAYDLELRDLARRENVAERVVFADYVPEDELEGLWAIADVAAFPTLGEGFGIPVIEAMARGVPVACSDIPVLREVAGTVARRFDPCDPADAAGTIAALLDHPPPPSAGQLWASRFSWAAAAAATWDVYDRVLAQTARR